MPKRTFTVIAYDIVEDRRRTKVAHLLENYGQRANYSVFECSLTDAHLLDLKQQLLRLMDEDEDRILIYPLCKNCFLRAEYLGRTDASAITGSSTLSV